MDNSVWQNSDVWRRMAPGKKRIIENLVKQSEGKKLEESAGIVLAAVNQMKREKLSFTPEETSFMMEVLTKDMSEAEKAKVQMMKNMMLRTN